MTRCLSILGLLIFVACAGLVSAQTLDELRNDGKNTDNVLTYGMGYNLNRYSALNQINKTTVKRLVPVWNLSLDNRWGEQAQPLLYNGVMYVTNARWTVAIDAATGKQLWRTEVDWLPETPRVVCCGVSNKGPAIYNGKVFRTTLDAFVVALDQKTGKQLWKSKAADWTEGYSMTVAPLVANGVLLTGISGAEFGIRGFIDGWDPETGRHLWRRYTTAGPGEPGADTWPPGDAYKNGGASTWITGSYDPDLDLVYWGTGNAGPWNPEPRGKLDNLYVASILAIKPTTGQIVWHYQATPNDPYDWDACWELILGNIKVDGQARKVLMQLNRNGFLYVIDRTNGKLLSAKPFEKISWATHVDMTTGRPVESDQGQKVRAGEWIEKWPGTRGAKNWAHAAFDPNSGLLFANTMHAARVYRLLPVEPFKAGQRYMFMEAKDPENRPADLPWGHLEAIDPMTAKPRWRVPLSDFPHWAAVLATGGGLVFTGKMTGEFIAVDSDTGKTLWQFQTGSGVNSQPITWTRNGKQYITVLSGLGGLGEIVNRQKLANVPQGGSVWTFALID
jgi:alcohol dehydrogenase (cytochrome c)